MKSKSIIILLVALAVAIVVVQEIRISGLRDELAKASVEPVQMTVKERVVVSTSPSSTQRRESSIAERSAEEGAEEEGNSSLEEFGTAMRKMADNPAAKAMFAQAHIAQARMLFGPLLEKLNLSKEEEDYFLGLVSGDFADQQQIGMKMMGAGSAEERQALVEEMEKNKEDRKKQIKEFLNNDEDAADYEAYADRLPEHQQMAGIRGAIATSGMPLTAEQETQLVEVMHEMRTGSEEAKKWDGAGAMEMMAKPNVEEIFEADWAKGQEAYKERLDGVLEPVQLDAFMESQAQMKQMHLMGIKMMSNMMKQDQ
ncbi:MAG: hypothetical protein ACSHYF_12070 [Verrucomicrobiaceae bacterium]